MSDIIIKNTTIVSMNKKREILENRTVVVEGDKIKEITINNQIDKKFKNYKVIDGSGKILLPGLINSHTHIALSLLKGVALPVREGLYEVMWPIERLRTAEDCYIGALAGAIEAVKNGTTTIVDRYFFEEEAAKAVISVGLRGFLGHSILSHTGAIFGEKELEEAINFIERWKNVHPLVVPNFAPHGTDTVDKNWLKIIRNIADSEGVGIQLHVAQTQREKDYINNKYGLGCVEYLYELGFLKEDVLCAHSIFLEDYEIEIFAKSGAHPVYCPMGHALSGAVARAWEMLQNGVKVLIGTDCVTINNVMDLLGELKIAGSSQKQYYKDPTAMPSMKILEMVTIDAAKALGMEGKLGVIEEDYLADMILIDFEGIHTTPNYFTIDNIIYCCNGRDVNTVIINGEIIVENQKLLTFDENEIIERAQKTGHGLISKACKANPSLYLSEII
jgi:5-methylthioadenosine/S-adenosylhomocysteine deaminase